MSVVHCKIYAITTYLNNCRPLFITFRCDARDKTRCFPLSICLLECILVAEPALQARSGGELRSDHLQSCSTILASERRYQVADGRNRKVRIAEEVRHHMSIYRNLKSNLECLHASNHGYHTWHLWSTARDTTSDCRGVVLTWLMGPSKYAHNVVVLTPSMAQDDHGALAMCRTMIGKDGR